MTRVEEDDAIKGAVLISAKPGSWIAGANIKMLEALESSAAAEEVAGIGQKGMDRIAAMQKKKPWVAAIDGAGLHLHRHLPLPPPTSTSHPLHPLHLLHLLHLHFLHLLHLLHLLLLLLLLLRLDLHLRLPSSGACLGGGLEMAMACSYRVATASPKTVLGLPEVMLGLLPGSGGTQRLIPLVGAATGLDLMLTGKAAASQESPLRPSTPPRLRSRGRRPAARSAPALAPPPAAQ